jgi:two-component system LytT family response regulator
VVTSQGAAIRDRSLANTLQAPDVGDALPSNLESMTGKIRTLIVDKDPLAREELKSLLQTESDILVVGELPDGLRLVERLRREPIDLIILDIQLPELTGFEALRLISTERLPAVIFVTADDRHALEAFEFRPVDYLVKPVDKGRLLAGIKQACLRHNLGPFNLDLHRQITRMLGELETRRPVSDRIAVKSDGAIVFIYPEEIDWVESAGPHVCLHTRDKALLLRDTLYAFEKKLTEYKFAWISRSTLVNKARIRTMRPASFGEYSIEMCDGTKLVLVRGFRRAFFESTGGF